MVSKKEPKKTIKSIQLDLFREFVTNNKKDVSNSIDTWESIPKYFINDKQAEKLRTEDGKADPFEWSYYIKKTKYTVIIHPAQIKQKDGRYKHYFPGQTEELVEESLKKILVDQSLGNHIANENETWVKFTLKMIHKELSSRGRGRTIPEIKHAIEVMETCHISILKEGKGEWSGSILQDLIKVKRTDYLDDPASYHIARFPIFISKAINNLQYRQYNYSRLMKCKDQLSIWIYRKLINNFTYAGSGNDYNFLFTTLEESGLLLQGTPRDNRKKVKLALNNLIKTNAIERYETTEKKEGRRIIDVRYNLYASIEFVKEQKASSKRVNDNHMVSLNNGLNVNNN